MFGFNKNKDKDKDVDELSMFAWEGVNRNGLVVNGIMRSTSVATVKADLRKQYVNPTKVKVKRPPRNASKKIIPADIAIFSRQLASMMVSGIPLVHALTIVANGSEKIKLQDMILNIKSEIEQGSTIADALAKHPKHFDELYVSLIAAGERSGALETLLDKIAIYKEKTESIKKKIKKALFYPVAVLAVAGLVSVIMLLFVIPEFEDLFSSFGSELPAFTRLVIDMSEWLQAYWWALFGIIFGLIFSFKQARVKIPAFNRGVDRFALKVPVYGQIVRKSAVARFARTLSTMFAAGVPLVDSLDSVTGATGNIVYGDAVARMKEDVATGTPLTQSMKFSGVFPVMAIQMVEVGEESGSLDAMLARVADVYEEEVDNAVEAMSSLMEPFILVILGGTVGSLVAAMYLPIFEMGNAM